MADTTVTIRDVTGALIPIRAVDNGDGTYSLSSALVATPTIDIGDVTLLSGSAVVGKVGVDQTTPGTTDSVTVKASEGVGSLTETAPATDTASSGLNGRLQRIAQRITSLIALLPAALGAGGGLKVDGSGTALPVIGDVDVTSIAGVVSTVNSTTTPLGIGGVFTGTAEDVKDYVTINIVLKSNVASAANGVSIQFSPDGTNWDIAELHTLSAGVALVHLSRAKARYFRVVFTNGGTGQSYFRLSTIFKSVSVSHTFNQLSETIDDTHDAALVRAILAAKKPNGDYANIQATAGENLKISLEEIESTTTVPTQITKTVAAIATPEALAADGTFFRTATVIAKKAARTANAGIVYLGIGSGNDTQPIPLNPGETWEISAPLGQQYDLNDWYLDAAVAADGVMVIYS